MNVHKILLSNFAKRGVVKDGYFCGELYVTLMEDLGVLQLSSPRAYTFQICSGRNIRSNLPMMFWGQGLTERTYRGIVEFAK